MFPGGQCVMEAEHLECVGGCLCLQLEIFIQVKTSQAVYVLGHPIRTLISSWRQLSLYDVESI